jgi:ferredoxin like protein
MSNSEVLKAKLGLDVFKPGGEPHIRIRPGMEKDPRLLQTIRLCPAGLYSAAQTGDVVLEWHYPEGGTGIQFRFG